MGMDDKRSSTAPVLIAIALLLLPLTCYVSAYFLRSEVMMDTMLPSDPDGYMVRAFAGELEAALFAPAAAVESLVTGKGVTITTFTVEFSED
jgi:hypothetical protein